MSINIFNENYDSLLLKHQNEFIHFLSQIENENILLREENEDNINRAQIQNIIKNYAINPKAYFDYRYGKLKGQFGRRSFLFNIINFHSESTVKNEKKYFYPNKNCEGYGLRVNIIEDVFYPEGKGWCIVYKNLVNDLISYKIDGISGNIIEMQYNDGTRKLFKIFYQCKIRQSSLVENNDGTLKFIGGPNDIIPYRIIKEHLSI